MFPSDLLQRIGLYPDGWNLVDVLAVVLEDYAALQMFRYCPVLFRIDHHGVREVQRDLPRVLIRCLRMGDGKVHVISEYPYDHLLVIFHLAFQVVVVCARHQQRQIHKSGCGWAAAIFPKRGSLGAISMYVHEKEGIRRIPSTFQSIYSALVLVLHRFLFTA